MSCTKLCQERKTRCLAVPATTLLHMGSSLACNRESKSLFDATFAPEPSEVCRGILPSLAQVVQHELERPKTKVSYASKSDSHQDPAQAAIDPFGRFVKIRRLNVSSPESCIALTRLFNLLLSPSDYTCKLCFGELANRYFHCIGCEKLLLKDFNICLSCLDAKRYMQNVRMHPKKPNANSDTNHTGTAKKFEKRRGCGCKQKICAECKFCTKCSCRCHHFFEERSRFFNNTRLRGILRGCEEAISPQKSGQDDEES